MSKIISLTAENVKRIKAVHITPTGNLVVIGGKNGQGKTSVLDSIMYALAGGDSLPEMPVRKGAEKAAIEVDLGDIIVRRTMTAKGGGGLVVRDKGGAAKSSPQAILDKLMGRIGFDPLEFARAKPEEQAKTLKGLVGLDFTKLDADRANAYAERTLAGRQADTLNAQVARAPTFANTPKEEQSADVILAEQAKAQKKNAANAEFRSRMYQVRAAAESAQLRCESAKSAVVLAKTRVQELESSLTSARAFVLTQEALLADAETRHGAAALAAETAAKHAAELQDIDLGSFGESLRTIERVNAQVRANQARADLVTKYRVQQSHYKDLSRVIDDIDEQKRAAIAAAKYPIPGMAFDQLGGITLNGIPLAQASSAEQLRVSVAVGLALNPTLRVLLCRDGSLLDDDSLAMLAEMAEKAGAQIWLERVGQDGKTSVVIEDGMVAEEVPLATTGGRTGE
jgi:hypothetical protein